jgi:hypothetical protein
MSYTVHNSTVYSDGMRTGYPGFTPNLAKCPNCAAVFFLHNLWAKKDNVDFEDTRYYKNIANPDFDDYIKIVQQELPKTKYEEVEARTLLWRALNRRNLNDNDDLMKLWKDNGEKLLSLIEQERNEKMREAESSKEDPTRRHSILSEISNLSIEIAELKRNLGRFDECLKEVENFPDSYKWLAEQFKQKCDENDRKVFKVETKE